MEKVLVIGDDMRSFLATVRSLGRQGLEVHAAPYDMSSPALTSRYIQRVHPLPFYLDGGKVWLDAVSTLLEREQFKLVIPCDERSLLPLIRHRDELSVYSKLAIPDARGMELFFDKHNTRELARTLHIPVANGRLLTAWDTPHTIASDVGLPLIAKYRRSYSWPEIYVRTKTTVIDSESELADWLRKNQSAGEDALFEHMFPGIGVGVSVLSSEGKILQAFEHHRVRELNGAGYYRKSAPLDPGRLDAVSKMVDHARYTGIAMFEFKVEPESGKWILLEVNARPWGSLPLPVSVGVDFPYRLYRLLARGETTKAVDYKPNIFGRNLVQDLSQVRSVIQMTARSPHKLVAYLALWLFEFRHFFAGHEFHDGYASDDTLPGVIEIKQACSSLGHTLRKKIFGPPKPFRSGLREKIVSDLKSGDAHIRILFVCEGNICRSPYAELKLWQLVQKHADKFDIASAGMLPRNRRASPQVAIEAAARRGVEMTSHLSEHAFDEKMKNATQVLIFDLVNYKSVMARYPLYAKKIFFIGELAGHGEKVIEITDPFGKATTTFDATYQQIDVCLQGYADTVISTIK
jgi:protein-tyrosine-phosphatase/predicted ATP-grasp superfamily ATP-dependent carboligase